MIPTIERLRKRLRAMPNGCWEYQGCRNSKGYGQVSAGHMGESPLKAHRVAWEIENGPIPDGLQVLHTCDNPPCCNSGHLFLGTTADNSADMVAKGRTARGEANGMSKLTWEKVHAIRADGRTHQAIADEHGVARATISDIRRGIAWKEKSF